MFSSLKFASFTIGISWPTVVEGDPNAPFQYLLHRGVEQGATPFPGLLHLPLSHAL